MTKKLFTKIELLEKQIAEEVKEKYALYKRIKELNEEIRALKNKGDDLSGPEYIQRHRT
jgi:cell division protein FtsB|tara:strand:+ start:641 stop:817 length:177 start_codon:yes stop_codon:yes gene_type:complete